LKQEVQSVVDLANVSGSYIHILIAFVFSIIRTIYSKNNKNILRYFMSAFVAVPVAVIVGEVAKPYFIENNGILFAVVAISALLSENIVAGILSSGATLQKRITNQLNSWFDYYEPRKPIEKDK